MKSRFVNWFKWKVAGDELHELWLLKQRINDLEVWCSGIPQVTKSASWLKDIHSYPCQFSGAYGSIDDFREYLRSLTANQLKGK